MVRFSDGDASEQRAVSEVGPWWAWMWRNRCGGNGVGGFDVELVEGRCSLCSLGDEVVKRV